jgi:hypothetical protein
MKDYVEDFQFRDGVLHVRLSGKFPQELLRRQENLFSPLVDACLQYRCKKALIDARDLQTDLDTMALFRAGQDAPFLTSSGLRVALLARNDQQDSFFDNVAFNRGSLMGIFTDQGAALEWLQKEHV